MGPFCQALASYRLEIVEGPDDQTRASILAMLDRWAGRPEDAESAWQSLCTASVANATPPPPVGWFIGSVVRSKVCLDRLADRVEAAPQVRRALSHQADREWKGGNTALAAVKKDAAQYLEQEFSRLLGREQNTAPRKRFMKMWRATLQQNCGKPLDGVVAMLTEVAFGGETSIDAVRGTRRPTRRDTRRKK
jgi:hypothetical protein